MKEMKVVVRVFAQVAVDLIAEVYDIDELPEIVEEYSSYVEDCGIKAAIEHYGGTTKDYGITDREPEVRDIDRDEFFDSVNSFVDRVNDSDLQAASVNAVEKTALIGRFINAVNAVKAGKQAASVNAVEKTALIGRLINAVNAVKAGKQTSSVNAVKTEIAPFVIDYRKRQEKYRKQREAAKRRKNAPVEISTAIEEYETVEPILITGNTVEDAKLICALNEHLNNIEWYSFYAEVFKREIFEGGDSDIRNQDRDTRAVCKEIRDTHENDYLELAKVYYRDEANENVLDKALLEARTCGTNNAVMIKREKGRQFYFFRNAARRTDKYTPCRVMKLRMA